MIPRGLIRLAAVASIAVCLVVTIIDALRGAPTGGLYALYGAAAIVFVVVGWLIAERRSSNAIGPLLVVFGALFAQYLPADLYVHLPGRPPAAEFAALFESVLDAPMFILIAVVLILFPDGRLPSPRWRWAVRAGLIGIGLAVAGYVFNPEPLQLFPDYRSPFGFAGFPGMVLVYLAYSVMLVLLILAAVALVVRWRRGNPVERAQIKWVVAGALVLLATEILNIATFRPDEPNEITTILASVGIVLVPIAMGIAILRYRLYEIDRVISRTLSYAVVTGILTAVFVGVILLLQALLTPITDGQTIAVAASTLAVFALFQPVLRRVGRTIDRQFDRARFDGDLTVAAFAARLRGDLDLVTVSHEISRTADTAVRPSKVAVWLRGTPR
jgi:hypothetical protein